MNNEQNINPTFDEIFEQELIERRERNMQMYNFLGKLTGWREGVTPKRKDQIMRGNMKVNALLLRFRV